MFRFQIDCLKKLLRGHWNYSLRVFALYGLGQNRLVGKVEAIILNLEGLV